MWSGDGRRYYLDLDALPSVTKFLGITATDKGHKVDDS